MSSPILPASKRQIASQGFNPESQPVMALESLPALEHYAIQTDFIRQAFSALIDWQVEPVFESSFVHSFEQSPQSVPSAVFMGLLQRSSGLSMLFTKRAQHLVDHAGQVSFPGGRIDAADANPTDAAVRETYEEVGIAAQYIEPLGQQPIFLSSTLFAMCPIVGLIHEGYEIHPSPDEVEAVFEVPLTVLMNPRNFHLHKVSLAGGNSRLYFSVRWQDHFIWGATAVIVRNLYRYLAAAQQQICTK
ncbi:CoA pyrophosphatase [Paenalcaligenes niemegkensis]|uniref:NUDIX hydrolase n=1 Tax=Paenalcaligenes niemegkensis TaxID=2895469 RepID=UPI001EE7D2A0|nr:CoA pyrophosphatase [Paenalcaligenes niemegkensis]MCQ9616782.1 CoA pyrophosphatase [Paenalcaligenes niemegkensis]